MALGRNPFENEQQPQQGRMQHAQIAPSQPGVGQQLASKAIGKVGQAGLNSAAAGSGPLSGIASTLGGSTAAGAQTLGSLGSSLTGALGGGAAAAAPAAATAATGAAGALGAGAAGAGAAAGAAGAGAGLLGGAGAALGGGAALAALGPIGLGIGAAKMFGLFNDGGMIPHYNEGGRAQAPDGFVYGPDGELMSYAERSKQLQRAHKQQLAAKTNTVGTEGFSTNAKNYERMRANPGQEVHKVGGYNSGGPISANPQGYNEGGSTGATPIKRVADEQKIELDKMTWDKMEVRKDMQMQKDEERKERAFAEAQAQKAEAHAEAMKMKKAAATTNKAPLAKG